MDYPMSPTMEYHQDNAMANNSFQPRMPSTFGIMTPGNTTMSPVARFVYGSEDPYTPISRGQFPGQFPGSLPGYARETLPAHIRVQPQTTYSWKTSQVSEYSESAGDEFSMSDSGYASVRGPQDTASLASCPFGDQSQDPGALAGGFGTLWPAMTQANRGPFYCEYPQCRNWQGKSRSELNKHNQRHNKSHWCNFPNCQRKEGFSTKNDLERHHKSLHQGSGTRYRCGIDTCRSKEKLWPRADNFKAHLKRSHQIDITMDQLGPYEVRDYTHTSPSAFQEPTIGSGAGFDISMSDQTAPTTTDGTVHSSQDEDEIVLEIAKTSYQHMPSQGSQPSTSLSAMDIDVLGLDPQSSFPPKSFILNRDECSYPEMDPGCDASETGCMENTQGDGPLSEELAGPAQDAMEKSETTSPPASSPSPQPKDETRQKIYLDTVAVMDDDISLDEVDKLDLSEQQISKILDKIKCTRAFTETVRGLGYVHARSQTDQPQEDQATTEGGEANEYKTLGSGKKVVCPECSKAFRRQCDLTKHWKRHSKPYGCTFTECKRTFGSKNDWRRHESSKHFQLGLWKCDYVEPDSPNQDPCHKSAFRVETFRAHLQQEHGLGEAKIARKLWSCRIGRNHEGSFWCGFCADKVTLKNSGNCGWDERFTHIDDHIFGRNGGKKCSMEDWKDMAPSPTRLDEPPEDDPDGDPYGASRNGFALPGLKRARSPTGVERYDTGFSKRSCLLYDEQVADKILLFTCCQCMVFQGTEDINDICATDNHVFCNNCPREWIEKDIE